MFLNNISEAPVGAIKKSLSDFSIDQYPKIAEILSADHRKGVQDLATQLMKKHDKYLDAVKKTDEMLKVESKLRNDGFNFICGIDEVGRGPLAGPVVCAAVIMPADSKILYVDDSKKLSATKRIELAEKIKNDAIDWKIGMCSPEKIDEINILEATKSAMMDAVSRLKIKPDLLLIDALTIPSDVPVKAVIHGDATCYSIAAASIIAKVYRDDLMKKYHEQYPEYDFLHNMGYGTETHIKAIRQCGASPIHRKSFIKNFI